MARPLAEEAPKLWRVTQRAVVVDAHREPRVLVVPGPGGVGWTVPAWRVERPSEHDPDMERIAAEARERLGFDVVLLHHVDPSENEAARERHGTWITEPRAQLERAVALLQTVQQLHHAQNYLQIQRSLEPDDYWQWEGELAQWLTPLGEAEPPYTA